VAIKCPKCHTENPDTLKFCGECGTLLTYPSKDIQPAVTETLQTPVQDLTTGSTFAGRYQIIEELGKGGMGKVYRVLDKRLKEEVALKLVKTEIASDKETIERFSNELKLARRISHRNVGRMYELMEAEGTYFITMEYVPGQDLRRLIRQTGQLTTGKAISIARQVCEGLSEAHGLSVVHRDLKPGNILIDRDGNAKIMDFGIARSISAKGITSAGVMIGTPEYMSPEQVEGKEADQRSDIYSLGIILYEMATGRVPFEGDTPLAIAVKHKTEAPRDPKLVNSQIPKDLSQVILRCLEKEKEKRYQTAGEVRSELEKIEKGIPAAERIVPERKYLTSRQITVTFGLKKLWLPALILIAVAAIGVIVWKSLPHKQASVAVLPFRDLSPKKDQEALCDGMTDEIIAKLSTLEGWKVMNMASALRFKNTEKPIKEIGRELNVTTVLVGSVRKEEEDIRVITQLVNADDEFQLWSDTYEQKIERVFEIQSDIAEKIVKSLKIKLSPEEKAQIRKKPTENMEAYNLYMQGRWFWNKRTPSGFQKSIEYFQKAIEIDPNYALAYAGMADNYLLLAGGWTGLSFPKAKEATLRALEIDGRLAEAHASLGYIKLAYDFDWEGSEKEFKRSIELNPNYATARHWYPYLLMVLGRPDEAISEIRRALELDPLSLAINRDFGQSLYYAREYDQAADALQRAIEMDPNFPNSHFYLGLVYLEKSLYGEAVKEIQREKEVAGRPFEPLLDVYIGIAYSRMGRKDEARKIMERLEPVQPSAFSMSYHKALLCFSLGENDRGFEYLDKESERPGNSIPFLKIDPLADSVRSDPRIKALLRKVNLE
jgi:eukaryotic-like serine/threonine-protein kinase